MNKEQEVKVKVKAEKQGIKVTLKSKTEWDKAVPLANTLIKDLKDSSFSVLAPEAKENKEPEKPAPPICPEHGEMIWKTGVSKKTGKPYAFWACAGKNGDGSFCKYQPPKK